LSYRKLLNYGDIKYQYQKKCQECNPSAFPNSYTDSTSQQEANSMQKITEDAKTKQK
jgi:hypothetical protein